MTALGASISAAQQIEDVAPPTRHVQNQSNTPLSAWLGNSSGKQPPRPTDEEEFPSLGGKSYSRKLLDNKILLNTNLSTLNFVFRHISAIFRSSRN